MFVNEADENRSASFHLRDGINGGRIPKNWVLLDSQSTTDAYSNPDLLVDIHEVKGSLTIHTQAGKAVTKLCGTVPGYGEVCFLPRRLCGHLIPSQRCEGLVSQVRQYQWQSIQSHQERQEEENLQTVRAWTVLL